MSSHHAAICSSSRWARLTPVLSPPEPPHREHVLLADDDPQLLGPCLSGAARGAVLHLVIIACTHPRVRTARGMYVHDYRLNIGAAPRLYADHMACKHRCCHDADPSVSTLAARATRREHGGSDDAHHHATSRVNMSCGISVYLSIHQRSTTRLSSPDTVCLNV